MTTHASAELLSAYLDRELARREARRLEEHLETCADCSVRLDGLRRVVASLQGLHRVAPPSTLEQTVARRIALADDRVGLLDRLEEGMSLLSRQNPMLSMFAVVIALALFIYFFSSALHQRENATIPVIFKDPPAAGVPAAGVPAAGVPAGAAAAISELPERWREMTQPFEPFRILGNLYYVGTSDVTAFLIATPEGHVLIDGGFEQTAPMILDSVERLGFEPADVEILLASHAHFDHAGGLAALKRATGARFFASEGDAPVLERGGLGDDLLGDEARFPPVQVDRRLRDGEVVELGGVRLTARVTAGHTRGCTSWAFDVEDSGRTHRAVSICSLSVLPGMRFREEPTYPGIAGDFERSFEVLESLPCDVFLASHASFFKMQQKRERLGEDGENPFLDREGYLAYVERARRRFEEALAEEEAGAAPSSR